MSKLVRSLPALSAVLAVLALALPGPATAAEMSAVKHVKVRAMSVGYREGGVGPPLVLIMGRSGTMADWDPRLLQNLSRGHHVVVFDNRGVATTDNPSTRTLTVSQMAADTLGLMSALGIKRADVMGWSMGGYIAQQVTIDAPKRVRRLVLCATSAGGAVLAPPVKRVREVLENPDLSSGQLFQLSFPFDRAGRQGKARYLRRVFTQPDLLPDSFTISTETKEQQFAAVTQWKSAGDGSYGELPGIRQRTLVAWARRDKVEPPANDRIMARRIPRASIRVWRNAGHAFLFQLPVGVGTVIRRFLR